jgi:excisionase family DNA binding protein
MLTLNEMARLLRVHPSTIYRLIRQHKVPAFRVGCEWRFDLEEVNKWIDKLNGKISDTPK